MKLSKQWTTPDLREHRKTETLSGDQDAIRKAFEEASDEFWQKSKAGEIIGYTLELKE